MPSDLTFVGIKLAPDTLELVTVRQIHLQAERPGTIVSRSDAIRHAIHSAPALSAISDPAKPLKLEDDKSGSGQERG